MSEPIRVALADDCTVVCKSIRELLERAGSILPLFALAAILLACARVGPINTVTPAAARVTPPGATTTSRPSPSSTHGAPTATATQNPKSEIASPLPVIVAEVDLGVRFERPPQHAVALDADYGRIFVGAPPDKTLILSTQDWRVTDTLPFGGGVAIDHAHGRLFIGAPSGVALYDLDSLQLAGTIPITASLFGSTPIVDESVGVVFVVNNGVYVADPVSLGVTARIAGTFPVSPTAMWGPYATDAALDAQNRRLYISLNNGIPGSNNGNTLMVHDLKSAATIYQDGERSIVSLEADESSGRLFVTRTRMDLHSFSVLEDGTRPAMRINGITGSVKVDAQRKRVYISDGWGANSRLLVLDSATGALVAEVLLPRSYTLAAFDAETDRLYFISPDGYLLVMSGHGAPLPAPQAFTPTSALTGSVAWIAPSPDWAHDKMLFAVWSPGEYPGGPLGLPAGQLLVSTDGSATWSRVRGLPANLVVNALAYSPDFARDQIVFAALVSLSGTGGGLYVSDDAGRSWRPATRGLDNWVVTAIAVAPGFPFNGAVFALTRQSGLFRSTDGGATWRSCYRPSASTPATARALAISPDFVNDHTLVVSSGESTLISRDGGDNWWPLLDNRATALAFSPDYARDRAMLGSFANVGVLRSDNSGALWQAASSGLRFEAGGSVAALALSPDFSRNPSAGAAFALVRSYDRSSVYRTTDGGASWQIESAGVAGKAKITAMAVSPDFARDQLIFFGLDDARVRAVKANDLKWSNAPAALDKLNVESVAISSDYAQSPPAGAVFIGSGRAGIFVSTGDGKWQETNFPARETGEGRALIALSPDYFNDRMVFAAAGGQVFRSNDGGANWQFLSSGLGSFFPASALAVSPQFTNDHTVLMGGSYRSPRVMRSADAGQTWSVTSGLGPSGSGVLTLTFVPGNGRVAYAWADQAGLYRSGDGGATWTRVFSPTGILTTSSWINQSLGISPDFPRDRLMFGGFVGAQNFRRSADGGATWHPADAGLPPGLVWGSALALSPDFPRDRLIYLGADKGVFRSDDGGVTWKASSAGLPQAGILSLAISPNFSSDRALFAGLVDRGLYVSTDAGAKWKPAR